jgi:flagellar protein FliO/FliZ
MAPGIESADLFRMIGSFILVLAVMAGLLWTLRKLQSRLNSQNSGKRMQVLETLIVGPRQKFALLKVGDNEVLVGITPSQMTSLGQWPASASSTAASTASAAIINAIPSDNGAPHVA